MRHRAKVSRRLVVACAMATLVFLASVSAASADVDGCITAEVPERFVLPDGDEYAPGKLTLCRNRQFSPARALLVGYVDRAAVGMLYAAPEANEPPADSDPFLVFVRDEEGKLHLHGYSVACRDGMESFAVEGLGRERIRVLTQTGPSARTIRDESVVLVPALSAG